MACVIFTPATAPEAKQNAIRRHGAVLHSDCADYDAAERQAKEFADAEGGVYISPYNHPDVIAGAGTIGLEIVEAMPAFDVLVVPLGGGGLASGVGLAVKAAAPQVTIVGVEVEASSPFTLSLEAGRITEITPRPVARRRPGRQPRTRLDHLPAGEAGRRLRRDRQRRRPRPGDEGPGDRRTTDRRGRRRRRGRGDHRRQGVRSGPASRRAGDRRQRRSAEVAVHHQLRFYEGSTGFYGRSTYDDCESICANRDDAGGHQGARPGNRADGAAGGCARHLDAQAGRRVPSGARSTVFAIVEYAGRTLAATEFVQGRSLQGIVRRRALSSAARRGDRQRTGRRRRRAPRPRDRARQHHPGFGDPDDERQSAVVADLGDRRRRNRSTSTA